MKLVITKEKINALPIDTAIILESWTLGESPRLADMVAVMAQFATDDDGAPMAYADARKAIGQQPLNAMTDLTNQFGEALRASAVPPASSGQSS